MYRRQTGRRSIQMSLGVFFGLVLYFCYNKHLTLLNEGRKLKIKSASRLAMSSLGPACITLAPGHPKWMWNVLHLQILLRRRGLHSSLPIFYGSLQRAVSRLLWSKGEISPFWFSFLRAGSRRDGWWRQDTQNVYYYQWWKFPEMEKGRKGPK